MITPSPTWQSCARWTYDMRKHPFPTVVLNDCDVPRLIVEYSRMRVPSPISTHVSSPLNFRSCGSPPSTVPMPTVTFVASLTFFSRTDLASSVHPSPTTQPSPTITYGPTVTLSPSSARGETMAVG